jgi:uncharacterized phiE125 gp8 family phage protein
MKPDTLRVISQPVVEPVSVADAKHQLGLAPENTEWDTMLADKIAAARELVESRLGRSLAAKRYRAKWKSPRGTTYALPYPPVLVDADHPFSAEADGDELAGADYDLEEDAEPAVLELDEAPTDELVVQYWAGPTGGYKAGPRVKSAILMYVEHMFSNRGVLAENSAAELQQGFETLLASLSHNGGW